MRSGRYSHDDGRSNQTPELKNWYCKNECPIGKIYQLQRIVEIFESITIKLLILWTQN